MKSVIGKNNAKSQSNLKIKLQANQNYIKKMFVYLLVEKTVNHSEVYFT